MILERGTAPGLRFLIFAMNSNGDSTRRDTPCKAVSCLQSFHPQWWVRCCETSPAQRRLFLHPEPEKAMAPHSSTLAWKIPWMEEPGRLQSMGSLESDVTEWLHFDFSLSCTGEGNGNPLQCSYLENPRDGGAWWAAVYGVAQSQTWLKWLSSSSTRSGSGKSQGQRGWGRTARPLPCAHPHSEGAAPVAPGSLGWETVVSHGRFQP